MSFKKKKNKFSFKPKLFDFEPQFKEQKHRPKKEKKRKKSHLASVFSFLFLVLLWRGRGGGCLKPKQNDSISLSPFDPYPTLYDEEAQQAEDHPCLHKSSEPYSSARTHDEDEWKQGL